MNDLVPVSVLSPLRQRLIDDMTMRRFSRETQRNYIRDVGRFATWLGRSPHAATAEEVRQFQIDQQEAGVPVPTMNSIVAALRFFFTHTLDRPDLARKLVRTSHQRKIPVVLTLEEMKRLLEATTCLKHQTALSVAYGAGLRVSEVSALKVSDIDSKRMLLRIERGKGGRYRNAMLPVGLLSLLRDWWRAGQRQGIMFPDGWLFPGQNAQVPLSTRQLYRVVVEAALAADINKRVGMHTLRHSFATHLLEDGVDIRVIQALLGHARLDTTAFYTQVATKTVRSVTSPLDKLLLPSGAASGG
jgi:integrase/recombinase XerD